MAMITRNCAVCLKSYKADSRALDRGWGLTCSKSCAATKREREPKIEPKTKKVTEYTRLGLILSIQAEIDAMKLRNEMVGIDNVPDMGYFPEQFLEKADELRRVATCDINELIEKP